MTSATRPARSPVKSNEIALSIADRLQMGGMISVDEFSAWAGICRRRVYGEIKDGRLKIVKIGSRTAIRARDAHDWQERLGSQVA